MDNNLFIALRKGEYLSICDIGQLVTLPKEELVNLMWGYATISHTLMGASSMPPWCITPCPVDIVKDNLAKMFGLINPKVIVLPPEEWNLLSEVTRSTLGKGWTHSKGVMWSQAGQGLIIGPCNFKDLPPEIGKYFG